MLYNLCVDLGGSVGLCYRSTVPCIMPRHSSHSLCHTMNLLVIYYSSHRETLNWDVVLFYNGSALFIFITVVCVLYLQDRTVTVWNIKSPTDITLRMTLKGHHGVVFAVDLSETTIISGSADYTIKVQSHVL